MTKTNDEPLNNTLELWKFIVKKGGLKPESYDLYLEEKLRFYLGLSENKKDFESCLDTISIENFIVAFFQSVQPYTEMMSDILNLFQEAGANHTNKNLCIKYNFKANKNSLKFDIKHFKQWKIEWEKILNTYLKEQWTLDTLWELTKILRESEREINSHDFGYSNLSDVIIDEPILRNWLYSYEECKQWTDPKLPIPVSGHYHLDLWLAKIRMICIEVIAESSKYGIQRSSLCDHHLTDLSKPEILKNQVRWSRELLAEIDKDNWVSITLRKIFFIANIVRTLPDGFIKYYLINKLCEKLEQFFQHLPKIEIIEKVLQKQLKDFLRLPYWKYRHEIYSIWIFTQIIESLKEKEYLYKVYEDNGEIVFSFSATHLATIHYIELDVYSEYRYPFPMGKKRKSIQPDYCIIHDPITNPKSPILVVECKQYLKASVKNFSEALSDYANGLINADVILVSYNIADNSILQKVDPEVRNRTHIIGNMQPNSTESQKEFKKYVIEAIEKYNTNC